MNLVKPATVTVPDK